MLNYSIKNKQAVRQLLDNLFSGLPSREKDVLIRRNHLLSELSARETLKEIGDEYNITRERVRQIENEGIKKLLRARQAEKELITMIEDDILNYFKRNGGIVLERHLIDNFVGQLDLKHYNQNAAIFVLDILIDPIQRINETEEFHDHWKLIDLEINHVAELIRNLVSQLEEKNEPIAHQELIDMLAGHELVSSNREQFDRFLTEYQDVQLEQLLQNYLNLSKRVNKNILDQWGLSQWPQIRPKKLSEKIALVFQRHNKPLHFSQVAENINQAGFDKKSICAATVHNELIANPDYTLVGRGIYAMKDWGYESGTVAEVIEKILKENGPMSKDDLYERVLKQRLVNKSTIYLSLINKNKFVKIDGNKFTLKA
ncbi:MAG: sigma factor-like helix-turn-helix DNA-binding protein [Patescibacteria group bacterium]